jgi:hypothetical protein
VDATDPVPRRRPWATHGECGCDAVAPAAPGPAPTRSAAAH